MIYFEDNPDEVKSVVDYQLRNAETFKDKRSSFCAIGSGYDIETTKISLTDAVTSYCYHWQFGLGDYSIAGRSLRTMLELFQSIIDVLNSIDKKLIVWDANLGYEFQFCKKYWQSLGLSDLFAKEKRSPLRFTIGKRIEMRECLGLFGHSLNQIANTYCETKKMVGDLDYSITRLSTSPMTEKEKRYCENDVKILVELGQYAIDKFFKSGSQLPITSTGLIRQKIKDKIGRNIKFIKQEVQENLPCEEDYNAFRKYLFKGGVCGTNSLWMNRVVENVICADLTSDYPAQMNHRVFPMGQCVVAELSEVKQMIADLKYNYHAEIPYIGLFEFFNVRSRTSHSLMSSHKCLNIRELTTTSSTLDNGRVWEADRLVLFLNDVEFKSFYKSYTFDRPRCIKLWKFESYGRLPWYVLDVLNEEYLKKEELKSTGKKDTIEYKDSKASVNGTFGMMCTSIFTDEWVFNDGDIEEMTDENGNIVKKSFEEATKSMFLNPFWGFWITSYARMILMHFINKYPDIIIQYDTDSLYFVDGSEESERLKADIKRYNENIYHRNDKLFSGNKHFRDLGAWDIEKPFRRFKGLGSKRYMYETNDGHIKFVVTGVPKLPCGKSAIQWQWEDDGKPCDIFEYFRDGLHLDTKHSLNMASKYIDSDVVVNYQDYRGVTETIECPSSVVLEEVEFNMGLSASHIEFFLSLQGEYNNSPGSEVKKIWKKYGI